MSVELAMEVAKLQSELHQAHSVVHQLRAYLAGALCAVCGEPLGDEETLVQNDEQETMHKHCLDVSDP